MNSNTFLFSDGRSAFLTQSSLDEQEEFFPLHNSAVVAKPKWIPLFMLMLAGIVLILTGTFNWVSISTYEWLSISDSYEINSILILGGVSIVIIGFMILLLMRKQYNQRIKSSIHGMKGSVYMSKQYIDQILSESKRKVRPDFR